MAKKENAIMGIIKNLIIVKKMTNDRKLLLKIKIL
jgi:hypothetical protein